MELEFRRADGTKTENAVGHIVNSNTGEIMYFEILGGSEFDGIPSLVVNGKELYKRIMIIRCFPVIDSDDIKGLSQKDIFNLHDEKKENEL